MKDQLTLGSSVLLNSEAYYQGNILQRAALQQSVGNFASKLQGFGPKIIKKGIYLCRECREYCWE